MAYVFSIVSDRLRRAEVIGFRGTEAVSRLFDLQIALRVDGDVPDPAELVASPLALEIRGTEGVQRLVGVLASATVVHADARGALLRLRLVPSLWRAGLSRHSRVFTDVAIPDVVRAVLLEDQVPDVELRLVDSYPAREHVGQYQESNLAFASRLLEREGMFYFFEHDGDRDRLVIADHPSAFATSREAPVPYRPGVDGGASFGESFFRLARRRVALPKAVRITDWNYRTPHVAVEGERPVATTSPGVIVRHGDHVLSPEEARRVSRIRAEQLASTETTFRGSGPVTHLRAGGRFSVTEHPREDMNCELVAIEVEHAGAILTDAADVARRVLDLPRDLSYRATVTAVRGDAPYRAPRLTPSPRVEGLVDGVVDGLAESPYAQIDEHGRYRVRLHFDEGDAVDGSRSTWVRMLQPHGGGVEGFHFPLRKGTEVHVAFAHGDPDRPVIVGVAPNPEKPSLVTAGNATQNVVQTGGRNRIEIEDAAGGQRVDTSCPTLDSRLHLGAGAYQIDGNTEGEGWWFTGADTEITVDGHKTEDVLADVLETFRGSHTLHVVGAVTETMATSRKTTVTGPQEDTWAGPLVETVTAPVEETYGAGLETTVAADVTLTYDVGETLVVTGGATETYGGAQDTVVTGTLAHTVTGAATELFGATSTRTVDGDFELVVDGPMTVVANTFDGQIASWNNLDDATKDHIENTVLELLGVEINVTGVSETTHALRMRLIQTSLALTGVSVSATGASVGLYGIYSHKQAVKKDTHGGVFRIEGAHILMKGLALFN